MTNEIAEVSKERSLAAVVAGDAFHVLERFENDVLILSPRQRSVHRRVVHINSYGGRAVWQKIKRGLVPNHQLLGSLQLVEMGYEVALPEPLPHFNPFRAPFP